MTTVVGTPPGVTASGYRVKPFDPATTTGLSSWFDAADPAVFTYGNPTEVASWADKSPNGFTVSRAPTVHVVRTGTINGVSCVTTINSGVNLTRASVPVRALIDPVTFTNCMTFVVMELPNPTQGGWFSTTTTNYRVGFDNRGANAYIDIGVAGPGRMVGSFANVANTPALMAAYRNGANMAAYRNGVQKFAISNASSSIAAAESGTMIVLVPTGGEFLGKIGEIYHVSRYHAGDFIAIQQYLAAKWGITLP